MQFGIAWFASIHSMIWEFICLGKMLCDECCHPPRAFNLTPPALTAQFGSMLHRPIVANYNVGPNGQQRINLRHPALRSPVDGIVTNAGEGSAGRIAIRDADGVSHELLHTQRQYVSIGDRVVAGQMLGYDGQHGSGQEIR